MSKVLVLLLISFSLLTAEFIEHRYSRELPASFSIDLDENISEDHPIDSLIKPENHDLAIKVENDSITFETHFPMYRIWVYAHDDQYFLVDQYKYNYNDVLLDRLEGNKVRKTTPDSVFISEYMFITPELVPTSPDSFSDLFTDSTDYYYWMATSDSSGRIVRIHTSKVYDVYGEHEKYDFVVRSFQTTQSHFKHAMTLLMANVEADPITHLNLDSMSYLQKNDTIFTDISDGYDSGSIQVSTLLTWDNYYESLDPIIKIGSSLEISVYSKQLLFGYMRSGPGIGFSIQENSTFGYSSNTPQALYFPNDVANDPGIKIDHDKPSESIHPVIHSTPYETGLGEYKTSTGPYENFDIPFFVRDTTGRHFRFQVTYLNNDFLHEDNDSFITFTLHWMADSAGNGKFDPAVANTPAPVKVNKSPVSIKALNNSDIQISGLTEKTALSVDVMNFRGQIVMKKSGNGIVTIPQKQLSAGAYLMKIKSGNGASVTEQIQRFVVQ